MHVENGCGQSRTLRLDVKLSHQSIVNGVNGCWMVEIDQVNMWESRTGEQRRMGRKGKRKMSKIVKRKENHKCLHVCESTAT